MKYDEAPAAHPPSNGNVSDKGAPPPLGRTPSAPNWAVGRGAEATPFPELDL